MLLKHLFPSRFFPIFRLGYKFSINEQVYLNHLKTHTKICQVNHTLVNILTANYPIEEYITNKNKLQSAIKVALKKISGSSLNEKISLLKTIKNLDVNYYTEKIMASEKLIMKFKRLVLDCLVECEKDNIKALIDLLLIYSYMNPTATFHMFSDKRKTINKHIESLDATSSVELLDLVRKIKNQDSIMVERALRIIEPSVKNLNITQIKKILVFLQSSRETNRKNILLSVNKRFIELFRSFDHNYIETMDFLGIIFNLVRIQKRLEAYEPEITQTLSLTLMNLTQRIQAQYKKRKLSLFIQILLHSNFYDQVILDFVINIASKNLYEHEPLNFMKFVYLIQCMNFKSDIVKKMFVRQLILAREDKKLNGFLQAKDMGHVLIDFVILNMCLTLEKAEMQEFKYFAIRFFSSLEYEFMEKKKYQMKYKYYCVLYLQNAFPELRINESLLEEMKKQHPKEIIISATSKLLQLFIKNNVPCKLQYNIQAFKWGVIIQSWKNVQKVAFEILSPLYSMRNEDKFNQKYLLKKKMLEMGSYQYHFFTEQFWDKIENKEQFFMDFLNELNQKNTLELELANKVTVLDESKATTFKIPMKGIKFETNY